MPNMSVIRDRVAERNNDNRNKTAQCNCQLALYKMVKVSIIETYSSSRKGNTHHNCDVLVKSHCETCHFNYDKFSHLIYDHDLSTLDSWKQPHCCECKANDCQHYEKPCVIC